MKNKSILNFTLTLILIGSTFGQSNPGFIGKKQVISLRGNYNLGSVLWSDDMNTMLTFGLGYERAIKRNLSLKFGLNHYSGKIQIDNVHTFRNFGLGDDVWELNKNTQGLRFMVNEISWGYKFSRKKKGAVAPLGPYFGCEAGIAQVKTLSNSLVLQLRIPPVEVKLDDIYAFNLGLQLGSQRFFNNSFGYFYELAIGFTVKQTSENSIFWSTTGNLWFTQEKEVFEYALMRQYLANRLLQLNAGLVYVF